MRSSSRASIVSIVIFLLSLSAPALSWDVDVPPPPSILYGQLFIDVQRAGIFPDQKTFCDLIPVEKPADILRQYRAEKEIPGFSLSHFVATHFRTPAGGPVILPAKPGTLAQRYIASLWNLLTEQTGDVDKTAPDSSLVSLPDPYVVPGGRFEEVYYWDSYFTMLGLEADGRHELMEDMIADFASEIDRFGHIPNGNRTYYLSRSQPPFFSKMIDLLAERDGERAYVRFLPELAKEYDFWMSGSAQVGRGQALGNVVRLRNGMLLNRYWDARDVPRDEGYSEDVATAMLTRRPASDVYRNLRATAESGWDFSSRWFADGKTLATVETVTLLPVDLNSLLQHLESTLARAYGDKGDVANSKLFAARAAARTRAIRSLMWDSQLNAFGDYSWQRGQLTHRLSAATLYPLFLGIATRDEADKIRRTVESRLLMPNGVATTLATTGQQWDMPNGWAPLQWIAVSGFRSYGDATLARTIAQRWIHANLTVYASTGKFVEKYDLLTPTGGGGGEYTTQIGYGWTNGVFLKLVALYG